MSWYLSGVLIAIKLIWCNLKINKCTRFDLAKHPIICRAVKRAVNKKRHVNDLIDKIYTNVYIYIYSDLSDAFYSQNIVFYTQVGISQDKENFYQPC